MESNTNYYSRRLREELALASRSVTMPGRLRHLELAQEFYRKLHGGAMDAPVDNSQIGVTNGGQALAGMAG